MGYSLWYLENLDMYNEEPIRIKKFKKEEVLADMIGEVEFHIDNGPTVKIPKNLPDLEEQEIAFSALPDIRSAGLHQESFIFTTPQGYFHVSFIQEKDQEAKRGYIQRSVFIRTSQIINYLPQYLSTHLKHPNDYTASNVLNLLIQLISLDPKPLPTTPLPNSFQKLRHKHKKHIFENLIKSQRFLVLGATPTEVSTVVCELATFSGLPYGGQIFPYKSSFFAQSSDLHLIIGATNEHIFKKDSFTNVIDLTKSIFTSTSPPTTTNLETHFLRLSEYFHQNPETFQTSKFLQHLDNFGLDLRTKRVLREFFAGPGFTAWLRIQGYTN
ncbi:hypothetical protein NEHOM01_1740 [Nematocida homosporus]|uniref:uncharacterized protein n=1 Tax=Nematocida homosporus TaxID=1912981 RepID=UPI00222101F3|nr:uncharacterized protein NEHOM01_1740 [Nematocida homosporus]KAI5186845.1 hypothetical protein NEHOM01_1740 [Nematocida homosporus]